jgi:hypothetical protein
MVADLLAGWLVGAVSFGAIPAGALILLMMMRLIPGAWGEQLRLGGEAATLLLPAAALAFVPVLLGMGALYPWWHTPPATGFQRFWLSPLAYGGCTLAWFAAQQLLALRLRRRRRTGVSSAIGLLLLPVLSFLVTIEWLLSLFPDFGSSVLGLQVLLAQVTIGFAAIVLLRLAIGRLPPRLEVIGALLLTLALMDGYFQFLPFFIGWSDNLPDNAGWYLARVTQGWWLGPWAFGLLGAAPLLALLFSAVRKDPRLLRATAASLLLCKVVELGWMVLPGHGPAGLVGLGMAAILLGIATWLGLRLGLRRRIDARLPRGVAA